MRSNSKARHAAPLLLAFILLSTMYSRGRLEQFRTVDALSLFASGLAVGVAMVNLLRRN